MIENNRITKLRVKREEIKIKNKDMFIKEIKVDTEIVDKASKRRMFLEEIDGNKNMLNMLSIERLKILEKYYDNIIKENDIKIRKNKS